MKQAQVCFGLISVCALTFLALINPALAASSINNQISYQAKLMDPAGFPVADGAYSVKISLYDASTAGTRLWTASGTTGSPTAISVSVANGLFTVLLGDTGQNSLDTVDWNSDSLYLGITIGADAEMTPRRRLAAAPQAFNARQLQGMYASGTAFGASSVFAINQTSNTAATGTRTALEVRSAGTSNANDYIFRGVNDLGNAVFTINRQGNTTSSGDLAVTGTVTTSQLYVTGQLVCLANGTNCASGGGTDLNWTYSLAGDFVRNATATTDVVIGSAATSTGAPAYFDLAGGTAGTSSFYFGHATNANVLIGGTSTTVGFMSPQFALNGNDLFVGGNIGSVSSIYTNGAFVAGTGTTMFGDGYINKTNGRLTLTASENIFSFSRTDLPHLNRWFASPILKNSVYGGLNATTTVGTGPTGIVFDGAYVWNANSSAGTVVKIDPFFNTVIATVPVGSSPQGVAFDGQYLWVVNNGSGNVSKVDVTTNTVVATTTVGTSPYGIAFDGSHMWVGNIADGTASKINVTTNAVAATVTVGTGPRGVAFDGRNIWVANATSDNVSKIDISTNVVLATVSVGDGPNGVAFDGSHVWAVNSIAGTVSKIDISTNVAVATTTVGSAPAYIAFDGSNMWVGNVGSDTVSKIDIKTNAVVATVPVGDGPNGIAFDGSHVWVANSTSGNVTKLPIGGGNGADMNLHVNLIPDTNNAFDIGSGLNSFRNIYASGTANIATDVLVGGVSVCLEDGTNCASGGGSDLNWTYSLASNSMRTATSTTDVIFGSTATSTGAPAYFDLSGTTSGTSNLYFGFNTNTNIFIGGSSTSLDYINTNFALSGKSLFVGDSIASVSSVFSNGEFVSGQSGTETLFGSGFITRNDGPFYILTNSPATQPSISLIAGTGTSSPGGDVKIIAGPSVGGGAPGGNIYLRPGDSTFGNPGDVYIVPDGTTNQPRLRFSSIGGGIVSVQAPNSANVISLTLPAAVGASSTALLTSAGGVLSFGSVCLTDGTNCPAGSGVADLNWTYVLASNTMRNATPTTDILLGSTATSTGAPAYFDLTGGTSGTSNFYFGHATNANVLIGGTSTSNTGLNAAFTMNGNDLFVNGNIGSVSSVYTNGEFVAGPGSTHYADGGINKNDGNLTIGASGHVIIASNGGGKVFVGGTGSSVTLADVTFNGYTLTDLLFATNNANDLASAVTSIRNIYASGTTRTANLVSTNATSTNLFATTLSATSGTVTTLNSTTGNFNALNVFGDASMHGDTYLGNNSGIDRTFFVSTVDSNFFPFVNDTYSIGQLGAVWRGYFSSVTTTNLNVNGQSVCLADGTNCLGGASSTLQQVTDSGASTTNQLYLFGGLIAASSTVTGTLTVMDDINFNTVVNATGSLSEISALTVTSGITDAAIQGKYAYVSTGSDDNFYIVDISNPAQSKIISVLPLASDANGVEVAGRYAYVSQWSNDRNLIVDVSDVNLPRIVATTTYTDIVDFKLQGAYAYVLGSSPAALEIYDNSNPLNPVFLGQTSISTGFPQTFEVVDGFAYIITQSEGLRIVDVRDPYHPAETDSLDFGSQMYDIAVSGRYAYVWQNSTFNILDIASATNARVIATSTGYSASNNAKIAVIGHDLYLSNDTTLNIIDVSSSTAPILRNSLGVGSTAGIQAIMPHGRYLLVVDQQQLITVDTGGVDTVTARIGSALIGDLDVSEGINVGQSVKIFGGLSVGGAGISSFGPLVIMATNTTSTISGAVSIGDLLVGGEHVCLANGTNCPSTDLNWTYDSLNDYMHNATMTTDVAFGLDATSSEIAAYFDLAGGTEGTSTFYFGYATNSNVVLGGTSGSVDFMHSLFSLNGNDLFVGGNIGSASSVYTNGAFIAGTGTTMFGSGFITQTGGTVFTINSASGTRITNGISQTWGTDTYIQQLGSVTIGASAAPLFIETRGNYAYVAADDNMLYVYDVSNSASPLLVGSVDPGVGNAVGFDVQGRYAYVAGATDLVVVDISNASNPVQVGPVNTIGLVNHIDVDGHYLYVSKKNNLNIYQVDEPTSGIGSFVQLGVSGIQKIRARNGMVYATVPSSSSISAINAKNPNAPYVESSLVTGGAETALEVSGNYLYVVSSTVGIVDISDPTAMTLVGDVSGFTAPSYITVTGRYAYVVDGTNIYVLDVRDPAAPTIANTMTSFSTDPAQLKVVGNYGYVGLTGGTFQVIGMAGQEAFALTAHSLTAGNLDVLGDTNIGQALRVNGALSVGYAGITSEGPFNSYATNTTSSFAGAVTVQGEYVCLADGTNCLGGSGATTSLITFSVASTVQMSLSNPIDVAVQGKYMYVADDANRELAIFDISDPEVPVFMASSSASFGSSAKSVFVEGDYAYMTVGSASNTLVIFDVSNPASPVLLSATVMGTEPADVYVSEGYAYVANETTGNLSIVDVSNPSTPVTVATISVGTFPTSVHVSGDYAYVANFGSDTLTIIDVSDPTHPVTVASPSTGGQPQSVYVSNGYAYVANSQIGDHTMSIFDVTNPTSPVFVTNTYAGVGPKAVAVAGHYAYITNTHSGSHVMSLVDISDPLHPRYATNTEAGASPYNIAISGRYAYIANYGFNHTVTIVEIVGDGTTELNSAHANLGFLEVTGDLTVVSKSTFIGNVGFGTTTEPITQLHVPGRVPIEVTGSSTLAGTGASYGIVVNERLAYIANSGNDSLDIYDISNPVHPTSVGSVSAGTDPIGMAVQGQRAYMLNQNDDTLQIFDVSNPANPVSIGLATTENDPVQLRVQGRYAYVVDQSAGMFEIFDVSDPTSIIRVGATTTNTFTDALAIQGRYAYVVNFTGSRLTVIDISNPSLPIGSGSVALDSGAISVHVEGRYAYVTSNSANTLQVVDISNPVAPFVVGTVTTNNGPYSVYVQNRMAYVATNNSDTLQVFDVSSSTHPVSVGAVTTDSGPTMVHVQGRYAYVVNNSAGTLQVFDMGGAYIQQLEAGGIETGSLTVHNSIQALEATFAGGLNVGGSSYFHGGLAVMASSTSATAVFLNFGYTGNQKWGAYIDQLTVGSNQNATGTQNYSMVLTYDGASTFGGLCLDDSTTANTCPTSGITNASILADNAVTANAFDLAEAYAFTGTVEPGDVVMMDAAVSTTVKLSDGTPYNPKVMGVVSTDPGFVLGWNDGARVALSGRVPTKVNMENGAVRIGDALTTSHAPGVAMKATKAGMIIGYALEDVSATGTVEMFVAVGYSAGAVIGTDGAITTIADHVVMGPRETASVSNVAVDSWGLTFRGQAWDAASSSVVSRDFTLMTDVISATSSAFSIKNASGTDLFTLDEQGNASFNGDVQVGGKLYLSSRGNKQNEYYVFLDETASTTYIGTNADGFQSLDTYDFAERFYSPDALESGDLVVVKNTGGEHVQRSFNETDMLVGIVSTRPAFIAGRPATDTYPIALTGRVPTKVSTMSGEIKAGDPLAPSNMPGIAVKATKTGPIVGLALEDYSGEQIGKINVYVNPGWWTVATTTEALPAQPLVADPASSTPETQPMRRGLAKIEAGASAVHVTFDTLNAYPFVQVTPRGLITGSWGTDHYTDSGFDIILGEPQSFDAYFSWEVEALGGAERLYQSDGTYLDLNQMTGEPVGTQAPSSTEAVVEEEAAPTSTEPIVEAPLEPEPIIEESASTTSSTN